GIAEGQPDGDIQSGFLHLPVGGFFKDPPDKHPQRSAQGLVYVRPDFLLVKAAADGFVVPFLSFPGGREVKDRQAKEQEQKGGKRFSIPSRKAHKPVVYAEALDPFAQLSDAQHPAFVGLFPIHQPVHARGEKQRHQQRYPQHYRYNGGKFREVFFVLFGKKENHQKGAYGGQGGRQQGQEHLPVPVLVDMVHHDDGVVHHQAERDCQPRKRIEMQVDFEEIKQDGRDAHSDDDAEKEGGEVLDIPVDQEDESDQDQDGEPGAFVYLVEFFFQELGVVVFESYLKAGGEGAFGLFYRLLDFFGQQYLVGPFPGGDRQGDRVVAVDAVVPFRLGLLQRKGGQVAEVDFVAPFGSDQQVLELRGVFQRTVDFDVQGLPGRIDGRSGIAASKGGGQRRLQAGTGESKSLHFPDVVGDIELQGGRTADLYITDVGKAVEDGL